MQKDGTYSTGSLNEPPKDEQTSAASRRKFIKTLTGGAAAFGLAGLTDATNATGSYARGRENAYRFNSDASFYRQDASFRVRLNAAEQQAGRRREVQRVNGDETRYPDYIASFTKSLPHSRLGIVRTDAYEKLLAAVSAPDVRRFESVPLGGSAKLANPMAGVAFQLEGGDSHSFPLSPAPAFASEVQGAELAANYWQALTRDVPFIEYDDSPLISDAVDDLSSFSLFSGLTTSQLFRGASPEEGTGPLISQFLWQDVPYGPAKLVQRFNTPLPDVDFMTDFDEWLRIQNGATPSRAIASDGTGRYIATGRHLAEWVHLDFSCQAYLNAGLILLSYGPNALDDGNPYKYLAKQSAFVTFGGPEILDLVSRAANYALKAAWYQKWFVHRRLRPEEFAGRVHTRMQGLAGYDIDEHLLDSAAVARVASKYGSYLLPMAYPEGCPIHPAYPAGHAVIAGACTTVLKVYFKNDFPIPQPKYASRDGSELLDYKEAELTIGGELNKLAMNIAVGRDIGGVHWRSDGVDGIHLGEAVAIRMLQDVTLTYRERLSGMTLTRFDGTVVTL